MAAPDTGLLSFFTLMENQGGVIVQETPKLDIDTYIQNYRGRTRFERLFCIARTSVPLCLDALKAAIAEAKRGKDVARYLEALEAIRIAAPNDRDAQMDRAWTETTERTNKAEFNRLTAELKGYKNNLIKESTRMGNEDLGKHLEATGNLTGAQEAYGRMRPDISTSKHIIDVGKHLVSVSLQRREWQMVIGNLNKVTGLQNTEDEKTVQPYLKIMQGVALMGQEKYQDAATSFLQADPTAATSASYNDSVSSNDVAVYGGLLALATMDRRDLQSRVLDNQNFRVFLELEPHLRRAITQFVNGRYAACLSILESYRPDYLLDIYLQKHVPVLYAHIRSKCIVQYLKPFSCVTLDSMNEAFALQGRSIEEELVSMIRAGILDARINAIDKVVTTPPVNPRVKMQMVGLQTAKNYEREALERIRRMNIIAADLEVKGSRKSGHHDKFSVTENWYDNAGD